MSKKTFDADHGDASELDIPMPTGDTKRAADKSGVGDLTGDKAPEDVTKKGGGKANGNGKNMASIKAKKVKEALDALFDDDQTELSEEFVKKTKTIFEATLNEMIDVMEAQLSEESDAAIAEELEELQEKIDTYATAVAQEWLKENELAVETGIKQNISESFFNGLRDLMVEHNVTIQEDEIDVVAALSEEVEELKGKLEESLNETFELRLETQKSSRDAIINEQIADLTESQQEKIRGLVEDLSFDEDSELVEKIEIIKENFIPKTSKELVLDENENLELDDTKSDSVPNSMARLAAALQGKQRIV